MSTKLQELLEQANLPWTFDGEYVCDKNNKIAFELDATDGDRDLILHSVNNLSRAIESLKTQLKAWERAECKCEGSLPSMLCPVCEQRFFLIKEIHDLETVKID